MKIGLNRMPNTSTNKLFLISKMKYTIIILIMIIVACEDKKATPQNEKIGGFIFDGPSKPPIKVDMVSKMKDFNANWMAITPEAFTYHQDLSVQTFHDSGNWYSETYEGSIVTSNLAKEMGLKVMLKPHLTFLDDLSEFKEPKVDFSNQTEFNRYVEKRKEYINSLQRKTKGTWRGDFDVINESEWPIWENQHSKFILDCAKIADSLELDMLCIGTELSISAIKRENYWRNLIKQVREIYPGPLTFSANWNNYSNIKFWDDLDYIGISAYFPLSEVQDASNSQIKQNWQSYFEKIKSLSSKFNKPILFTEYGYPSGPTAAQKPWRDSKNFPEFHELQYNLYKVLYNQFWNESWFAGGFIWKWKYTNTGESTAYSPQGKRAEEIIKQWYKQKK